MIRGIHTSATGMEIQKLQHQALADNLANASTSGYKSYKHIHKIKAEANVLDPTTKSRSLGNASYGSEAYATSFDFTQGALKKTGNPLDVAIVGEGFFAVQNKDGGVAYTRNGHFTLNVDGFLVTQHGEHVLDLNFAPVYLGLEGIAEIHVLHDGDISVDGIYNTTLAIFEFPEEAEIEKMDADKYVLADSESILSQAEDATVKQGFTEQSNVSSVKSAADMVQIMRNYEANQHAMRAQIDTVNMLMNIADGI